MPEKPTRRDFLNTLEMAALSAAAVPGRAGIGSGPFKEAFQSQPNIVIILAEDLGWADVGYHGGRIDTPHIDRLAREGVRLENFHVYPLCSPTRAGLLTGRWGVRRVWKLSRIKGLSRWSFPT